MPRVTHVKKARKDNPVCKKGESYFWWKFRYGGKRYSLKRPRPSMLTQSAYYGAIRSLGERIEDQEMADSDELSVLCDEVRDELTNIREECQGNLDNMPDSLQYAPTGELLQERIDALDYAESDLDGISDDFEPEDEDDDEETQQEEFASWLSEKKDELCELVYNCEV